LEASLGKTAGFLFLVCGVGWGVQMANIAQPQLDFSLNIEAYYHLECGVLVEIQKNL